MALKLLNRGANIDYVNSKGKTALIMCVEMRLVESVRFLLQNGASLHIMDLKGRDACDKAQKNGLVNEFLIFNTCSID